MKAFSGAFMALFGLVYVMLMTNLMLAVTCAPVWILAVFVPLNLSWLWVAVTAILLAPALAGTYEVFKGYSVDKSYSAIRPFFRAWWRSWRRVGLPGLAFQGFFFVVCVDFYTLGLWGYAMVALPVTVVLLVVGVATALVSWVGLLERPDLPRRAVIKAAVYLAIRKFGWTVISLLVVAALAMVTYERPAIGLGLLIGPALYVVWGNSRRTLSSILPDDHQVTDEDSPVGPRLHRGVH